MNLYAAAILIPVGVIMYTAHGGLKVSRCRRQICCACAAEQNQLTRNLFGPRILCPTCQAVPQHSRMLPRRPPPQFLLAPPWLQATFMSTYLHTIVVFVALCLFAFEIYANKGTGMGSPSTVWDHLTDIATLGGAYKGVSGCSVVLRRDSPVLSHGACPCSSSAFCVYVGNAHVCLAPLPHAHTHTHISNYLPAPPPPPCSPWPTTRAALT